MDWTNRASLLHPCASPRPAPTCVVESLGNLVAQRWHPRCTRRAQEPTRSLLQGLALPSALGKPDRPTLANASSACARGWRTQNRPAIGASSAGDLNNLAELVFGVVDLDLKPRKSALQLCASFQGARF